jgi:hypothetical protein
MILLQKTRDLIEEAQKSQEKIDAVSLIVDGLKVLIETQLAVLGAAKTQAEEFQKAMTGVRPAQPVDLMNLKGPRGTH